MMARHVGQKVNEEENSAAMPTTKPTPPFKSQKFYPQGGCPIRGEDESLLGGSGGDSRRTTRQTQTRAWTGVSRLQERESRRMKLT